MLGKKLLIVFLGCLIFSSCGKDYDTEKIIESWETGNQRLKVRVTSHLQKGIFPIMGSTYHVFESSNNGEWMEIITVRHDDPRIPIDKNSVKFVNEDICFIYSGSGFAVTTDVGNTWTLWDGRKHNYLDKQIHYGVIKQAEIRNDGNGEMMIWVYPPSKDNCQTLLTKDYGRSWVNGNFISECSF